MYCNEHIQKRNMTSLSSTEIGGIIVNVKWYYTKISGIIRMAIILGGIIGMLAPFFWLVLQIV